MKSRIPDSVLEIKLRLGGGMRKNFQQMFNVEQGEKLLKGSRCYLSTTAGLIRTPYKVVIPVEKIKRVEESQNVDKPKQKYIEIVTVDHFDFWFMGFVNYEKAFKCLQNSIHISQQQSL
ncbi:hypothetical protein MKW94_025077 [Papaver nudicaule]|uniref:GRAM domain-containing protein n=1 Tax=Papaver nudicaule TaxID=74823 RepID=A0AA41V5J4_PAPNU|nr:hypothetical protein [Papaver nudicaule]